METIYNLKCMEIYTHLLPFTEVEFIEKDVPVINLEVYFRYTFLTTAAFVYIFFVSARGMYDLYTHEANPFTRMICYLTLIDSLSQLN